MFTPKMKRGIVIVIVYTSPQKIQNKTPNLPLHHHAFLQKASNEMQIVSKVHRHTKQGYCRIHVSGNFITRQKVDVAMKGGDYWQIYLTLWICVL